MTENAVANLLGEIQSLAVFFQLFHHTDTLLIVAEASRRSQHDIENTFSRMTERRMTQIVSQRNRLSEILIKPQRTGNGA